MLSFYNVYLVLTLCYGVSHFKYVLVSFTLMLIVLIQRYLLVYVVYKFHCLVIMLQRVTR